MKIADLHGKMLEVTNLQKSLKQAKELKDLHHDPPVPSDHDRQKYWRHLYESLLTLKATIKSNKENNDLKSTKNFKR